MSDPGSSPAATVEYLQVSFPGDRGVRVDGRAAGRTNEAVELEAGTHSVTLDGPRDFAPPSQIVELKDTTVLGPKEIAFQSLAPSAPTPQPPGPSPR